MDSLTKHSFSRKPKLDRRNAQKIPNYEPSDSSTSSPTSPRSSHSPASFSALDRDPSRSFRVLGGEGIDELYKFLGISGGADAFGISEEDWNDGKMRRGSRLAAQVETPSPLLDGSLTDKEGGREVNQSPDNSPRGVLSFNAHSIQSNNSLEAADVNSFARDLESSRTVSRDLVCSPSNLAEDDNRVSNNERENETYISTLESTSKCGQKLWRSKSDEVPRPAINEDTLKSSTMEIRRQTLLPPPPVRFKLPISSVSTQQLLLSFAPEEDVDLGNRTTEQVEIWSPITDERSHKLSQRTDKQDVKPVSIVLDYERSIHVQRGLEGDQTSLADPGMEARPSNDTGLLSQVGRIAQERSASAQENAVPAASGAVVNVRMEYNVEMLKISEPWRKLDVLGSGSFGTVYEGMTEDGVYFAVKEVSLSDQGSKAQQSILQLEQEIALLSIYQHDNIVRYLGTEKEHDKLYIFLELVTKGSLASLYQKYPLFDSQIRIYTRQILSGLKYLHDQKIVHRDIKCANILVDVNGRVKLADFGLAKQISEFDELKSCKGSAYWMAPEVVDPRKSYSFLADIWSLGCTVLEMATRRPPFGDMEWNRAMWKIGHGEAPPIPGTLSEDAQDFIRMCLEINPGNRPTASQLLDHSFVQYAGGTGLTPRNSFSNEAAAAGELHPIAEESLFAIPTPTSSY